MASFMGQTRSTVEYTKGLAAPPWRCPTKHAPPEDTQGQLLFYLARSSVSFSLRGTRLYVVQASLFEPIVRDSSTRCLQLGSRDVSRTRLACCLVGFRSALHDPKTFHSLCP